MVPPFSSSSKLNRGSRLRTQTQLLSDSQSRSQRERLASTTYLKVTLGKGTQLERQKEICEIYDTAAVSSRLLEKGDFFGETALFSAISDQWKSAKVQHLVKTKVISDRVCELGRTFCEEKTCEDIGEACDDILGGNPVNSRKRPIWGSVHCKEDGKLLCLPLQDMACLLHGDWSRILDFLGHKAEDTPSEVELMEKHQGLASYNAMKRSTLVSRKSQMKELEFWRVGGHLHRVEQWECR